MIKLQVLLIFLQVIPILLFMLQDLVVCIPVSSQKEETKRQRVGKVRNYMNATHVHLKNLRTNYYARMRSERNARKDGLTPNHTNKEEWMIADRKQVAINANLKKHRLIARLMDNPKIGDHLNDRADNLKMKYDKLQKHKDNLKQAVDPDAFRLNDHISMKHFNEFDKEERKCENEIGICSKYLSIHDPNHAMKGKKIK